ncbi:MULTISPECIES: alpha/beta fold hydrolase [Marinobacter]|jgi:pimeloyl-ACP methyl ester carboxylesterase|uniref:Alpha/beta fold hydrolase n=6 Tax=Pseudomonadota TaxID=1224 RepID=A0ABW2J194_9GAMM|nr:MULTISPECIES: alpha/beta fold hydrolase [Marinobacter]WOI17920.1 alpha/beta fold hydrolase [Marinobacter salarius]GGE81407.1 peroxidase [Streptosporangium jomthongense]
MRFMRTLPTTGSKRGTVPLRPLELTGASGWRLAAEAAGESGWPPVLLLHGGGQTRHAWAGTARQLAGAGYFAIALDARGHGDSQWAPDGDYSADALVADLAAVRASLRASPVLVGASMGGLTSLLAVGEGPPDFARALVLVDVATRLEPDGVARVLDFMRAHTGGFANLEEAAEAVSAYNPHRKARNTTGLRKNLRQHNDGRWYWHWDPRFLDHATRSRAGEALVRQKRREAAARRIRIPTLLVRGGSSDVLSPEGAHELQQLVPHAERFDVEDAGHMVAGDRNDVFSNAVIEFLRRKLPAGG